MQQGLLIRQVLKGKKKVRLTFIPTDISCPVDTALVKIAEDVKGAWKKILGNPADLDIDQGLIMVRFNPNGYSGTAQFFPNRSTQNVITNPFQQEIPDSGVPTVGGPEFLACIDGKRSALGSNFNYAVAAAQCLPQLFS